MTRHGGRTGIRGDLPWQRRDVLGGFAGIAAAGSLAIAGCLDAAPGDPDDDGATDGDGEEDDSDDDGTGNADLSYDTESVMWSAGPTETAVVLLVDNDDATRWLERRRLEDDESAVAFLDGTSFDEAAVIALEAGVPTPCHSLELDDVALEDGGVRVEAAIRDGSAADEDCPQQEMTVARFVRASVGGEAPTEGTVHLVDRDGTERSLGFSVEQTTEGSGSGDSDE